MAIKKTTKPSVTKKTQSVRDLTNKTQKIKTNRRTLHSAVSKFNFLSTALKVVIKPFDKKPVRKVLHIFGLILWPRFFRKAWAEVRMVIWPSGKETLKLTRAVIVFAIIFGAIIAIADFGLDKIFKKFILN